MKPDLPEFTRHLPADSAAHSSARVVVVGFGSDAETDRFGWAPNGPVQCSQYTIRSSLSKDCQNLRKHGRY